MQTDTLPRTLAEFKRQRADQAEQAILAEWNVIERRRADAEQEAARLARLDQLAEAHTVARFAAAIADHVAAVVTAQKAERAARAAMAKLAAEYAAAAQEVRLARAGIPHTFGIGDDSFAKYVTAAILAAGAEVIDRPLVQRIGVLLEAPTVTLDQHDSRDGWGPASQLAALLDGTWSAKSAAIHAARETGIQPDIDAAIAAAKE